ncbi:neuronal acetylcholine receptor subunit alpha-7 [Patella vulgata]|uniref:neuronal acetylcholine receptor subunit alpha-7 n=1 Tax=Patella vulgata TaxID=6465 RepID=UPI00218078D2|nr:neuronal acetylcholine receptor subunit alpha-7 [Patella vulgata]
MYLILRVLALMTGVSLITSTFYSDHSLLRNTLFSTDRYDPLIRPVNDTNEPLKMYVSFGYSPSIELDETVQLMSDSYWFRFSWTDHFLKWNPENYSGISQVYVPQSSIWKPRIAMYQRLNNPSLTVNEEALASVNSSGVVAFDISIHPKTRCLMEISKFPFDVQTCVFFIMDEYLSEGELYFDVQSVLVMDEPESEWILQSQSATVSTKYGRSIVNFQFIIRRQPSFYVITIIIPLVTTASLNPLVFLIPPGSGEKISVAVTILLSYTVFLNVISGILPETSTSTSIVSEYITTLFVLSGLYTIFCVIIVKIDNTNWSPGNCVFFRLRDRRVSHKTDNTASDKSSGEPVKNVSTAVMLDRIMFVLCSFGSTALTCWCFASILR